MWRSMLHKFEPIWTKPPALEIALEICGAFSAFARREPLKEFNHSAFLLGSEHNRQLMIAQDDDSA